MSLHERGNLVNKPPQSTDGQVRQEMDSAALMERIITSKKVIAASKKRALEANAGASSSKIQKPVTGNPPGGWPGPGSLRAGAPLFYRRNSDEQIQPSATKSGGNSASESKSNAKAMQQQPTIIPPALPKQQKKPTTVASLPRLPPQEIRSSPQPARPIPAVIGQDNPKDKKIKTSEPRSATRPEPIPSTAAAPPIVVKPKATLPEAAPLQWVCEHCEKAVFDTFKEACDHEAICPAAPKPQAKTTNNGNKRAQDAVVHKKQKQQKPVTNSNALSNKKIQEERIQWVCEFCEKAVFDTYQEACKHEETCKETVQSSTPASKSTKCEQSSGQVSNSFADVGRGAAPTDSKEQKQVEILQWVCEFCEKAVFATYQQACAHEAICPEAPGGQKA